jgi:hypothetical protein
MKQSQKENLFLREVDVVPSYHGELPRLKQTDNGKFVMEFEQKPALVFVSMDGHGSYDTIFANGKELLSVRKYQITSEAGKLTTLSTEKEVCIVEN